MNGGQTRRVAALARRVALGSAAWGWVALLGLSGCSLQNLRERPCVSDQECTLHFGSQSECVAGLCANAGPALRPKDRCEATLPELTTGNSGLRLLLDGLSDQVSRLTGCLTRDLPGPDGFVELKVVAGERWFVQAQPTGPQRDPALYLLTSCATDSCSPQYSMNACGPGQPEVLTYLAPESGRVVLGIDDGRAQTEGTLEIIATRSVCGNGRVEQGETCDDGNLDPQDGCDALCRAELVPLNRTREIEPNEEAVLANVIEVPRFTSYEVEARLERCDIDTYAVRGIEGASEAALRVTMLDQAGSPCVNPPRIGMEVFAEDGNTLLTAGAPSSENGCPATEMGAVTAEEVRYVRIIGDTSSPGFDYRLRFGVM